jgi:uncharacterized protein
VSHLNNGFVSNHVLKINVGFLLHEPAGSRRDYEFDVPQVRVDDDVMLSYLRGKTRLTRTTRGVLVQGQLAAGYQAECARCLESIVVSLELPIEELFVHPPTPQAEFAVQEDGFLNLAPLLREEAIVHVPMNAVCRSDCKGLCPICGHNLNKSPCKCEKEAIDPRFAVLKQLHLGD